MSPGPVARTSPSPPPCRDVRSRSPYHEQAQHPSPYFGLEAGYADFGEIEPLGSAGPRLEGDAAYLVAVGTVPFTDSFSGYAKAGINDWNIDGSVAGLIADDSGNDPTYGLGLQYRFTDNVALRGEYSRLEIDDSEVDLAQLQLRFDF